MAAVTVWIGVVFQKRPHFCSLPIAYLLLDTTCNATKEDHAWQACRGCRGLYPGPDPELGHPQPVWTGQS